ncbi:MAG TPA: 2-oxoacid:acceptor oxidoreductase family protein [Thermodesulfovibrionales bacterium]|nr:2-oxoacid:acceptor oxidoreductase family protein [Thermodesulfovibrionales bacterium]
MQTSIIIAGSGGQGILFLGRVVTSASMLERKEVTWFPSYGAEMRGGTANCTVIIADEMIGSPVVLMPDILIAMNRASLARFFPSLRKKGMLFYDSSLITEKLAGKGISTVPVPATSIAGDMGSPKLANMVMLGAFIARTGILRRSSIFRIFDSTTDPRKIEAFRANKEFVRKGIDYIENT